MPHGRHRYPLVSPSVHAQQGTTPARPLIDYAYLFCKLFWRNESKKEGRDDEGEGAGRAGRRAKSGDLAEPDPGTFFARDDGSPPAARRCRKRGLKGTTAPRGEPIQRRTRKSETNNVVKLAAAIRGAA